MQTPEIVSASEWQQIRDELLVAEKEITRAQDALAARRRRLPMVEFANDYEFDSPGGRLKLLDLFGEQAQLMVYQFMNVGPEAFCPGCTWFTNNVPQAGPSLLALNGMTFVVISDMPLPQIERIKTEKGWDVTFVSSSANTFAQDCGAGGGFMLSVFLRDGDKVYRTYNTTSRGVDRLVFANSMLDLAPYGRQEAWEDSPPGWPQS